MKKWLILSTLFLISHAQAFVPSFPFTLSKMAEKREKVKTLYLAYQVTAYQDQRPTTVRFHENFFIDFTRDVWLSQAVGDQNKILFSDKKKISDDATALATLLQFDNNDARIQRTLNRMGFRVDRTRLDKVHTQVAWVYGNLVQLWFKKDEFTPFRWMHPNSKREKGNPIEIAFDDYKDHKSLLILPTAITVSSKGLTLFRADLQLILVNDKKILDSEVPTPGWSADGENSSPVMKELIERYYTHVR